MSAFLIQTEPQFCALVGHRIEIRGHLCPGDTVTVEGRTLVVVEELPPLHEPDVDARGAGLKRFYCKPAEVSSSS